MDSERLATLALAMDEVIPPSGDGRLPGAGQLGLAAVLAERSELEPVLAAGLDALDERARAAGGSDFASLSADERRALFAEIPTAEPAFFGAVLSQTFVAYYQHPEVLAVHGLGGRPPFPIGYAVPATDFSILDRVRERGPFYRTP